jgi:hypothetical protein
MIIKFGSLVALLLLQSPPGTTADGSSSIVDEDLILYPGSDASLRGAIGIPNTKALPISPYSYSTRKLTSEEEEARASSPAFVHGDCVGPATFLGIPFTASAYDVCTSFKDDSEAKFGICGDPNLALDGQPNDDPVCQARAGVGGECHVAFTAPGEWLEYSFNINEEDHSDRAVFNVVLRVAANRRRYIRVTLDNGGNLLHQLLVVEGTGFFDFHDVMWERVRIPGRGPERIFVEFVDGLTNFCSIRVEETTLLLEKELEIPFHADAQHYISFYEKSPETRSGTCGPGAVDSQPTQDKICNDRGSQCNIGWTEAGEQVIYLIQNPSSDDTPTQHNVTLRLASHRNRRRVMFQVEGQDETYMVRAKGNGYQNFDDLKVANVTFPPGQSRLIVTFVDRRVNMCSLSIQ